MSNLILRPTDMLPGFYQDVDDPALFHMVTEMNGRNYHMIWSDQETPLEEGDMVFLGAHMTSREDHYEPGSPVEVEHISIPVQDVVYGCSKVEMRCDLPSNVVRCGQTAEFDALIHWRADASDYYGDDLVHLVLGWAEREDAERLPESLRPALRAFRRLDEGDRMAIIRDVLDEPEGSDSRYS